jgi:hypothetical protein
MGQPSDSLAAHFPVSIKGVVFRDERVVLLRNEREILEELSIAVSVERLLDCWVYDILGRVKVLIVTYGCSLHSSAPIAISGEHKEAGLFRVPELDALPMPEGYKASVRRWWKQRYTG